MSPEKLLWTSLEIKSCPDWDEINAKKVEVEIFGSKNWGKNIFLTRIFYRIKWQVTLPQIRMIFFLCNFFFLNVNIGSDNISVILVPTLPKNVILVFQIRKLKLMSSLRSSRSSWIHSDGKILNYVINSNENLD